MTRGGGSGVRVGGCMSWAIEWSRKKANPALIQRSFKSQSSCGSCADSRKTKMIDGCICIYI